MNTQHTITFRDIKYQTTWFYPGIFSLIGWILLAYSDISSNPNNVSLQIIHGIVISKIIFIILIKWFFFKSTILIVKRVIIIQFITLLISSYARDIIIELFSPWIILFFNFFFVGMYGGIEYMILIGIIINVIGMITFYGIHHENFVHDINDNIFLVFSLTISYLTKYIGEYYMTQEMNKIVPLTPKNSGSLVGLIESLGTNYAIPKNQIRALKTKALEIVDPQRALEEKDDDLSMWLKQQMGLVAIDSDHSIEQSEDCFVEVRTSKSRQASKQKDSIVKLFDKLDFQNFDARKMEDPIVNLGIYIYNRHELQEECISYTKFLKFLKKIQDCYLNVPYHNVYHVTEVGFFTYCLLHKTGIIKQINKIDLLAIMVACFGHDAEHPGVNSSYLNKMNDKKSINYGYTTSVLEQYHLSTVFNTLEFDDGSQNFIHRISFEKKQRFRNVVRDIILATDVACHKKYLERASQLDGKDIVELSSDINTFILLVKLADLGHFIKSETFHIRWVSCVLREFYYQGDLEKDKFGSTIGFMDKEKNNLPDGQVSLAEFMIKPLILRLNGLFENRLFEYISCFNHNISYWKNLIHQDLSGPFDGIPLEYRF